jgi:DNA-binding transcriptional LysR family regulator
LDLGMREADVAIRMMPPRQPDLIQRHLMTVHINIYAAASYVRRRGMPKAPEDLDGHALIVYGEDSRLPNPDLNWLLRLGKKGEQKRTPVLCVNNVYAILKAVQSGIGIGALPEFMIQGATDLVRVLPDLEGPRIDTYFVYPEELRNSKRIQVFRDFLLTHVAKSQF